MRIERKLDAILVLLAKLLKGEAVMNTKVAEAIADLKVSVEGETNAKQAIITTLNGIAAQLAAMKDVNPDEIAAQVAALAAQVRTDAADLAAAALANTSAG